MNELENLVVYEGIEWFACWLMDNVEGEIITEEQLRPWAYEALLEYKKKNENERIKRQIS